MARCAKLARRTNQVSLQDPKLPLVAISSSGSVTRINAPARKALGDLGQTDGPNLGSLVARFFSESKAPGGRVVLAFVDDEGKREEVTLVLSDGPAVEAPHEDPAAADAPPLPAGGGLRDARTAGYIAHELRNPIGTILGFSRILESRYGSMSENDRILALHSIEGEAARALLLLEGLVRLAQTRTKTHLELSNVPLQAVLRKVVTAHRHRYPERQIVMTGDSPAYARADSVWIELALGNLLSNAEKYTPRDCVIEVAIHQTGNRATIFVLDNGITLPSERYAALWDLYLHGPDPDVVVSGSGIGLAVCKELVECMGGRVWAGARDSRGSVFAISLPAPWDMALPEPLETPLSHAEAISAGWD